MEETIFEKIECDVCGGTGVSINELLNEDLSHSEPCEYCNGTGSIEIFTEGIVPHKMSRNDRRIRKKKKKIARRGTNFNTVKPKKGFKRVKVGNKYVRVRMGANERKVRKLVGRAVGRKSKLFR